VTSAEPTRLLVFTSEATQLLVRELPSVAQRIREAVRQRLPG
jgi:hypothetical protein